MLQAVDLGTEWVGILPPPDIFAWIHGDLVSDNAITVPRANVRSGPGINYGVMARVEKGQTVKTHGSFNEWLKISPPEGCVVWISRQYVESPEPTQKASPAPASPILTNAVATVGIAPKPPMPRADDEDVPSPGVNIPEQPLSSAGITSNMLLKTVPQEVAVSRKGILKKASMVWRRPSRYVLIDPAADGEDKSICYVTGSEPQLEAVLDKNMTVSGKEYTVEGARYPVLNARKITLH